MSELNLYYRAIKQYKSAVIQDKNHAKLIKALQKAPAKSDKLETVRTKCIIDESWIKMIEQTIPYIEKAIREDRQFIRQEGEVVRIEKAKKVSKASVSHLARHSDMITHLPENEEDPLLPDKLYITENESNYAVYENRFLYMLLCYTRDFVELRYTKISELGNTYRGALRISKHVEIGKRTVVFDATLNEVAKNDPLSESDRWINELIERLEAIRVQVTALLLTPLMNEVSKSPMIRPPITRTNVLKMDNNFKRAVELYDYLSSYEGAGYTIEEIKKRISPLTAEISAEVFEVIPALSHLTYKFGNGLERVLEEEYLKEEDEIAMRESRKRMKELADMRKRLKETGQTSEEYLVQMETYVHAMENQMERMKKEAAKAQETAEKLKEEIELRLEREETLKKDMGLLREENAAISAEKEKERSEHEAYVDKLNGEHQAALDETRRIFTEQIDELSEARHNERRDLEGKISALDASLRSCEDERFVLRARLHAYQGKNKDIPDCDLTEEENFLQLEKEREWFEDLYRKYWKKTKKRIRREVLWSHGTADAQTDGTVEHEIENIQNEELPFEED